MKSFRLYSFSWWLITGGNCPDLFLEYLFLKILESDARGRPDTTYSGGKVVMYITQNNYRDVEILFKLVGVLSAVQDGHYPANPAKGSFEGDPVYFDPENTSHLRDFYNQLMGLMDAAPDALFKCVYMQQFSLLNQKAPTSTVVV